MNVQLDGEHLTIEDVCDVAEHGVNASLSPAEATNQRVPRRAGDGLMLRRIERSRRRL